MRRVTSILLVLALLTATVASAQRGPAVSTKTSSITAGANSSGLTLSLDCSGAPNVTALVNAGAAATVTYDISADNSTWYTHTTLLSAASGTAIVLDRGQGMPYVRLNSTTASVALTYVIGCKL